MSDMNVQGIPNVWVSGSVRHWFWDCPTLAAATPGTVAVWATWEPGSVEPAMDCAHVGCVWVRKLTEGYLARLKDADDRADQLEKALLDIGEAAIRAVLRTKPKDWTPRFKEKPCPNCDCTKKNCCDDTTCCYGLADSPVSAEPAAEEKPVKYERCSGRHVGGDSCTSEVGHKGPCTFGLDIEPKRAASSVSAGPSPDAIEKALGMLEGVIKRGVPRRPFGVYPDDLKAAWQKEARVALKSARAALAAVDAQERRRES